MSDGFIIKRGGSGGDSNAAFKARVDGSLTEVTAEMLQGITKICNYAFYNLDSLTSVEIPNSVTSIGNNAFQDCSNLANVEITNSVTSISNQAFQYVKYSASITIKATTPPTLGGSVFDTYTSLVIYVPAESVDAYKSASGWSEYASKIQAIPSEGD